MYMFSTKLVGRLHGRRKRLKDIESENRLSSRKEEMERFESENDILEHPHHE